MELTMMHHQHTTIFSKISSALHDRISRASHNTTPTPLSISPPRRTVISSPPRRLSAEPAPYDLRHRAVTTLTSLYSSTSCGSDYISPSLLVERDDEEPVTSHDEFRSTWEQTLRSMPDFQLEVSEAVVDEAQRKVWVRSEISGLPGGRRKESIDMLTFDGEGVLIAASGTWRPVKGEKEVDADVEE